MICRFVFTQKKIIYDNRCLNNILFMSHAFAWISVILTAWFLSFFFLHASNKLNKMLKRKHKNLLFIQSPLSLEQKRNKKSILLFSSIATFAQALNYICFIRIYCPAALSIYFNKKDLWTYRIVLCYCPDIFHFVCTASHKLVELSCQTRCIKLFSQKKILAFSSLLYHWEWRFWWCSFCS